VSVIYVNGEAVEITAGTLKHWLFKHFPKGGVVALDTEASGLYIDGDWQDAPPARVSAVSMAWREKGGEGGSFVTVALAFDQGKIAGKPGKWSKELDTYETLPHTEECSWFGSPAIHSASDEALGCTCAPWNLNEDDWEALVDWLTGAEGAERKLVKMHHGKYDSHIVNAGHRVYGKGLDLTPLWVWDTMLAQGIINPLDTSALKPTGERLWGYSVRVEEQAVNDALKQNGVRLTKRYDLVDWAIMGPYAAKDAELTYRLADHQEELIAEGAVPELDVTIINNELELAKCLFKMELRGVGFDADGMRVEADKMIEEIKLIEEELPFEASINAAKRYFFGPIDQGGLGLVPVKVSDVCELCTYNRAKKKQAKNTKKELCKGDHKWKASLDSEVVARLVADKVPGADQWQHLANMNSALSKWYRAWPYKTGPDGRIRTNFRQGRIESDRKGMTSGGAISGRLSAERIQLQGVPKEYQLPKSVRGIKPKKDGTPGLILAKPGHQVWEVDASNAEVRVAAWLAQCESLAAVINSGVNIHDGNTRNLFGLEPDHSDWELYRTVAKTTIFGDLYGAGVRTLKAQIEAATKMEFPESKVKAFKDALKTAYPELSRTARRCQSKADKSMGGCGYVRLVNGRKRVFGWAERTHKAFNACIQGGVAETMKTLMLMVEAKHPGILINQVHDSLWLEVPDLFADLIVKEIQDMGAKLFTETFSTEDLTVNFEFDAKQLA
jgi:DNA polymerase I-like protein with 3'-5' exonuclease and polymerase domains